MRGKILICLGMVKYAIAAFIAVVVLVAGYFVLTSNKSNLTSQVRKNETVQNTNTTASSPSQNIVDTSDDALDNDLTALDKDLADLGSSDPILTSDINGL